MYNLKKTMLQSGRPQYIKIVVSPVTLSAAVAEWLRAWDTLTMFEAMVCGRS